jgi:hypothetical protein
MSKRPADEQLTKDDGAESGVSNGAAEGPGSITKASEEELASRRCVSIMLVCRQPFLDSLYC